VRNRRQREVLSETDTYTKRNNRNIRDECVAKRDEKLVSFPVPPISFFSFPVLPAYFRQLMHHLQFQVSWVLCKCYVNFQTLFPFSFLSAYFLLLNGSNQQKRSVSRSRMRSFVERMKNIERKLHDDDDLTLFSSFESWWEDDSMAEKHVGKVLRQWKNEDGRRWTVLSCQNRRQPLFPSFSCSECFLSSFFHHSDLPKVLFLFSSCVFHPLMSYCLSFFQMEDPPFVFLLSSLNLTSSWDIKKV